MLTLGKDSGVYFLRFDDGRMAEASDYPLIKTALVRYALAGVRISQSLPEHERHDAAALCARRAIMVRYA